LALSIFKTKAKLLKKRHFQDVRLSLLHEWLARTLGYRSFHEYRRHNAPLTTVEQPLAEELQPLTNSKERYALWCIGDGEGCRFAQCAGISKNDALEILRKLFPAENLSLGQRISEQMCEPSRPSQTGMLPDVGEPVVVGNSKLGQVEVKWRIKRRTARE